jgi:hypothetical protein
VAAAVVHSENQIAGDQKVVVVDMVLLIVVMEVLPKQQQIL